MHQYQAIRPTLLFSGVLLVLGAEVYREQTLVGTIAGHSFALTKRLLPWKEHLEKYADANAQRIAYDVRRNFNQPRDLVVLQQTQLITKRADTIADSLEAVRVLFAQPDTAPPLFPAFNGACRNAGAVPPAQLTQLAQHLNRYAAFIRQYVPEALPLAGPLARSGQQVDFGAYYFSNLPTVCFQATLARLQTQVRRYEADAMSQQAQKVSGHCWGFDRIGAAAVPVSNTVAPGGWYEAKLLLVESSNGFYYKQMSVNGRKISRFEDEHGMVDIAVPHLIRPSPDTLPATWSGRISTSGYPVDSAWQLKVPYSIISTPRP